MIQENAPVLIPLIYLFFATLIPIVGVWPVRSAFPLAMLAVSLALSVSVFNLYLVLDQGTFHYYFGNWIPPIGIEYVLDPLSAFVTLVINAIAFWIIIHSGRLIYQELPGKRVSYYALVLLLLCGFNGIVLTGDLFNLYVFLEIASLAGYGLIAVGERGAPVAAFRYLIMGTIAASFYLLGLGYLYLVTGTLNMADMSHIVPALFGEPPVVTAISLMTVGIGIKMALFPLHGWLPDAYTLAPSTSSALIAPTGTKVGAYVIIRILFFIFGLEYVSNILPVTLLIGWLAAIAIIYGSIMAMAQNEVKRMLAYSSLAQIGYIGLGIGLANPLGLVGALLHILNHAFMKGALFLVAANLRSQLGHSDINRMDESCRMRVPWTMAAFTVAALSMIGIPPTAGFFSKWYLARAAIENANWLFLVVILISSLLNAVYFFRILEKVYLKPLSGQTIDTGIAGAKNMNPASRTSEVTITMLIPTLVLSFSLLLLGLFNAVIVKEVIQIIIPIGM